MVKRRSSTRNPKVLDRKEEARFLDRGMRLLAIEGPSTREGKVADFIIKQLLDAGAKRSAIGQDAAHKRTGFGGQCGNLVLKLPGTTRAPRRMLMAHMDTVPLCVGSKPVRRGRMIRSADPTTGLGADDRAGVTVILNAALEILRRRLPHPPLTFLWTIHEEGGLHGARHVSRSLLGQPSFAYNWDGGAACKLTVGATGGYRMTIDVHGKASHAGMAPAMGINAISVASIAIAELTQEGWHGLIEKEGGRGTSNFGLFEGGQATNVVADHVRILAEARSHQPKFRKRIVREIKAAFDRAAKSVKNQNHQQARVEIEGRLDYESFLLSPDEPCLLEAERAIRACGETPLRAVADGGVDANWMVCHGIPTVTLGCGQKNQHTLDEALDVDQWLIARRIALELATGEV